MNYRVKQNPTMASGGALMPGLLYGGTAPSNGYFPVFERMGAYHRIPLPVAQPFWLY